MTNFLKNKTQKSKFQVAYFGVYRFSWNYDDSMKVHVRITAIVFLLLWFMLSPVAYYMSTTAIDIAKNHKSVRNFCAASTSEVIPTYFTNAAFA